MKVTVWPLNLSLFCVFRTNSPTFSMSASVGWAPAPGILRIWERTSSWASARWYDLPATPKAYTPAAAPVALLTTARRSVALRRIREFIDIRTSCASVHVVGRSPKD